MNDWEEKKKQLMQTPVFRDMPEYVVGEVAKVVEAKTVPQGTTLFRKGEPGDSFWMVETGKVRVFRQEEERVELTLSELGPRQSFGEMALLTEEPDKKKKLDHPARTGPVGFFPPVELVV